MVAMGDILSKSRITNIYAPQLAKTNIKYLRYCETILNISNSFFYPVEALEFPIQFPHKYGDHTLS